MQYDYKILYEKNAAFYRARPKALRALKLGNTCLSLLFVIAYATITLYFGKTDKLPPLRFTAFLFLPCCCVLCTTLLRLGIDRPRPYAEDGAGIQPLIEKNGKKGCSCPSRHVACAFVIAVVSAASFPLLGAFLFLAAALLGYVRFAAGLHYPSDLIIGAAIGIAFGGVIFFI